VSPFSQEVARLYPDARDATKEPPAMLDPLWVLDMRRRLRNFQATGDLDWYPASRGPCGPDGALNINGGN
jgi:hypothetical protein